MKTLTDLGLTLNQARIYTVLIQSETALTAKDISKLTKISRQDVYRTLPDLQKDGLVEKTITVPTSYQATCIKVGLQILMKKKKVEQAELLQRAQEIMDNPDFCKKARFEQEPQFILVPEKDAIVQKLNRAIETAQKSLDIVSSKNRLDRATFEFFDARKQALQRGVRIRAIHERIVTTNPQVLKVLEDERKAGVQTRFVDSPPTALITLIDEKEVMLITSASGDLETAALWSNNASFVAMAKYYFESLWNNTAPSDS